MMDEEGGLKTPLEVRDELRISRDEGNMFYWHHKFVYYFSSDH